MSTGPAALVGTGSPTIIVVIRPGVMAMAMAVFLAVLVVVTLLTGPIDRYVAARLSRTPDPDAGKSTAVSHGPIPAGSNGGPVEFDSEEELAETVLVASRLGGYVSTRFYQRAMASLAAQDEARHGTMTLPESGI